MEPNLKLHKDEWEIFHDLTLYRRLVRKLLYLINTRPDVSYSVNLFSQSMSTPRVPQYSDMAKVLKYIKGTPKQGIFFSAVSKLELTTYSDAN